jgi:hypothetical protein
MMIKAPEIEQIIDNASGRHTIPFFSFSKDSVLAIPRCSRNFRSVSNDWSLEGK